MTSPSVSLGLGTVLSSAHPRESQASTRPALPAVTNGSPQNVPPPSPFSLQKFFKTPVVLFPSLFLASMQSGRLLAHGTATALTSMTEAYPWAEPVARAVLRPEAAAQSLWLDLPSAATFAAISLTALAANYGLAGIFSSGKSYPDSYGALPDRFPASWTRVNSAFKKIEMHARGGFFAHADIAMKDDRPLKDWNTPGLDPFSSLGQSAARYVGAVQDYGAKGSTAPHKLLEYGLPGTVGKFKAMPAIYATAAAFFGSFFLYMGIPDETIRLMVAANGLILGPVIFGMLMTAFQDHKDNKFAVLAGELAAIFVLDASLAVVASPAIRPEVAYGSDLAVRLLMLLGGAAYLSRRSAPAKTTGAA